MHERIPSGSSPSRWIVSRPWRPHARAALMASQGTLSLASCSAAMGRMTSREKRRIFSWNSRCSSLSLKSTVCPRVRRPFAPLTDESIIVIPSTPPPRTQGCALGTARRLPHGSQPPATRNTIGVGGSDAAADPAGVAGALYPATGDSDRPTAVVLVPQDDWVTGIAAAVLTGRPIGAPILLTDGGELPAVTEDVLERLDPKGSDLSRDAQGIRVGPGTARPEGFKTALIEGDSPFERAAAIDRFFSAARARPSNDVVLYSAEDAEFAMPVAAWAARAGDAVLPVRRDTIPAPIVRALRE